MTIRDYSALAAAACREAPLNGPRKLMQLHLADALDRGDKLVVPRALIDSLEHIAAEAMGIFTDVQTHTDPRLGGLHMALKTHDELATAAKKETGF